jgi:hypothetical protein
VLYYYLLRIVSLDVSADWNELACGKDHCRAVTNDDEFQLPHKTCCSKLVPSELLSAASVELCVASLCITAILLHLWTLISVAISSYLMKLKNM